MEKYECETEWYQGNAVIVNVCLHKQTQDTLEKTDDPIPEATCVDMKGWKELFEMLDEATEEYKIVVENRDTDPKDQEKCSESRTF